MPLNEKRKSKQTLRVTPTKGSQGPKKPKFDSATVQSLYDRYVGDDAERAEAYEAEVLNAEIARTLHDLRIQAGLSQRELAKRVGTSASAISRLEDADYEGHSLSLLKRIEGALGQRVEVRFSPVPPLRSA